MKARVREIVAAHTGIDVAALGDEGDLWRAGMTSKVAVRIMLDVEDELGVQFPPAGISHESLGSVAAIAATASATGDGGDRR